jgi:hypothetical protein
MGAPKPRRPQYGSSRARHSTSPLRASRSGCPAGLGRTSAAGLVARRRRLLSRSPICFPVDSSARTRLRSRAAPSHSRTAPRGCMLLLMVDRHRAAYVPAEFKCDASIDRLSRPPVRPPGAKPDAHAVVELSALSPSGPGAGFRRLPGLPRRPFTASAGADRRQGSGLDRRSSRTRSARGCH